MEPGYYKAKGKIRGSAQNSVTHAKLWALVISSTSINHLRNKWLNGSLDR